MGNKFFLVDPLDGTKEFIDGNHDFTVNIALIENGKPVMGVVYMPITGNSFYGDQQGAIKTYQGKTMPITISGRAKDIRVMASRSQMDERLRSNMGCLFIMVREPLLQTVEFDIRT